MEEVKHPLPALSSLARPLGLAVTSPWCGLHPDSTQDTNSPAQDNIVVKEVHFDVLKADGLIEALRNEKSQKPAEIWSVKEGDADLLRKPLQEW